MRIDYNARGYRSGLTDVTDSANAVALETFDAMNAYGQVSRQTYGNGVATARAFDAKSGRLKGIDTTRGAAKIQTAPTPGARTGSCRAGSTRAGRRRRGSRSPTTRWTG